MKKLSSLLLLAFLHFHLYAQPCPSGFFTLNTQESVDNFATDYPNCTTISGSLFIQGNINNLDGLSQLTGINNFLQIQDAPNLTDISGLQNITAFSSDLIISNCASLTNLNGLEGISSSSFIFIGFNPNLVDISGLNGLSPGSIGFMGIEENPQLAVCNEPFLCESLNGPPFLFVVNNAPGCNSVDEILLGCPNEVTCPPTGLTINSQEDIDNFVAQYPDCTQLPAGLLIESPTLTNLDGLEQLVSTNGFVSLRNNNLLENLNGLQNLAASNAGLEIRNNDALTDLSGLENIINILGPLRIEGNENLSDISALNNIITTSVTNYRITSNSSLSACAEMLICDLIENEFPGVIGFNALGCNSIAEVETICNGESPCPLFGVNFSSQQDIDNFLIDYEGCTSINGNILISGADINNLNPLSAITNFNGNLFIQNNPLLQSLNGIETLLGNSNGLDINNNNILTDISALNGIFFAPNMELIIRDNSLLSLCNYSNICTYFSGNHNANSIVINNTGTCATETSLLLECDGSEPCPTGDLVFNSQGAIDSFLMLYPICTEIAGDVRLAPSAGIQNLSGLERIEIITGDLRITKNSNLSVLGLNSLESVGGNLKIENTDLEDFRDLENLANIGGYFRIGYNPDLLTLSGLENLTTIPRLKIEFNPLLNNLNGLSNVNTIDGYLKLRSNTSLLSLHGLANVSPDEITELEIINNTALVLCDQNNICTYLETDEPRTIFNNSDGCNSEMDIQDNCANTACDNNDLILETQAEVDDFAVNYPDCIVWSANLSIQGTDITNLDGLSQLIAVEGNLSIEGTSISSLAGLDQLIVIYGDFTLGNNNAFTFLEEVPSIGGSLIIQDNELLSDCAVASVCYHIYIGGAIDISNNALGCESTTVVESTCNATVQVCSSISNSDDDAEETMTEPTNLTSSDLEMLVDGDQQVVGLRFLDLDIPKNAIIKEANIQFTSDQTDNQNPCQLNLFGELSDNPLPFASTFFNISTRLKTDAVVSWSPPNWEQKNERGPAQKTIDISPILQEIVNQTGYTQNDPIAILIFGTGKRTADSYDGNPEGAAQLCLTYTENTAPASEHSDNNNNTITSSEKRITVFPNPTNGLLQVDLSAYAGEAAILQMHNGFGAMVLAENLKEVPMALLSLQLSHLPKGLYWISVKVGNERVDTMKVLVN